MVELSQRAAAVLGNTMQGIENPRKKIRLLLEVGGCCGPQLRLMLDRPRKNDETYTVANVDVLVSPSTFSSLNRFNSEVFIDYVEDISGKGFTIQLKQRRATRPPVLAV